MLAGTAKRYVTVEPKLDRGRGHDRGAAAVEFAIILPLLFLVIGGVVDLGRALYSQVTLTNAAREGARAAVVGITAGSVETRAMTAIPEGPLRAAANVTINPPSGCVGSSDPLDVVDVEVSAEFDWILLGPALNMIPGEVVSPPSTLGSSASMRCGG